MCGFIAQLVEHRTGIAEVTGSNPVEALIFFRLLHSNCLNWKFTAKITYHLHKIGYVQHDTCTFCKVNPETVYHLFYECPLTRFFWENFENFWFVLTGQREKLTLQDVYIGNLEKCELLNYFITLAKLHIWLSRKQSKIPKCEVFIELVGQKYRTEKYIAVKNNTQKIFQARWQLYR